MQALSSDQHTPFSLHSPDFLSFAMSFLAASELPLLTSDRSSVVFPIPNSQDNFQINAAPKVASSSPITQQRAPSVTRSSYRHSLALTNNHIYIYELRPC